MRPNVVDDSDAYPVRKKATEDQVDEPAALTQDVPRRKDPAPPVLGASACSVELKVTAPVDVLTPYTKRAAAAIGIAA